MNLIVILTSIIVGLCASAALSSPRLVSAEIVAEQAKILQTALDELEKCKHSSFPKNSKPICQDELIRLRWKIEQVMREKEIVESRTLFEHLQIKTWNWLETIEKVWISWSTASMEENLEYLKVHGTQIGRDFTFHFLTMAAGVISMLSEIKENAERMMFVFLKQNLPTEYVQYAEGITSVLFIGLPAFCLAVIWHKLTKKIQDCLARIFLGKKTVAKAHNHHHHYPEHHDGLNDSEFYLEEDDEETDGVLDEECKEEIGGYEDELEEKNIQSQDEDEVEDLVEDNEEEDSKLASEDDYGED